MPPTRGPHRRPLVGSRNTARSRGAPESCGAEGNRPLVRRQARRRRPIGALDYHGPRCGWIGNARRGDGMRVAGLAWLAGRALVVVPSAGAAEWTVSAGPAATCVVESSAEPISDGYQASTARIRVDGKSVLVSSGSVLDPGFDDIGIAVDDHPLVHMDRLGDSRTAVF